MVSDPGAGTLVLIDRAAGEVAGSVDLNGAAAAAGLGEDASPQGFVLSPDGAWAFVSAKGIDRVAVIHLESRRVVSFFESGSGPDGIAFSPGG